VVVLVDIEEILVAAMKKDVEKRCVTWKFSNNNFDYLFDISPDKQLVDGVGVIRADAFSGNVQGASYNVV